MLARTTDEITAKLADEISPVRFRHTLGVLHTGLVLAELHQVDANRLQYAALLHDCAKEMGRDELMRYIRSNRLPVSGDDLERPAILHAPVGAHLAETWYGVDDRDVLDAIRHHPTGTSNPSRLLQVLMAADFTEPTRDFDGVEMIRESVRTNLKAGVLQILKRKQEHLEAVGRQVHPGTLNMIETLEA